MKGAREYAGLFNTGQCGRLYIVSSSHARGRTFHIQVLPEGEEAISNGNSNLCINRDAVEVYGIVSGRPGWTEAYGWLHDGPWRYGFYKLVQHRKEEFSRSSSCESAATSLRERIKYDREIELLSSYKEE